MPAARAARARFFPFRPKPFPGALVAMDPQTGRPYQGPVRVGTGNGVIPPGKSVNLQTSLGPFNSGNVLNHVKWQVERAMPAE
jgi:hypothetical protein